MTRDMRMELNPQLLFLEDNCTSPTKSKLKLEHLIDRRINKSLHIGKQNSIPCEHLQHQEITTRNVILNQM